jgi:hypothetical protein
MHVPHHSHLKWMFLRDSLLHIWWDDMMGRIVTGLWGVAWVEWIVIAFLFLLVWRHGGHVIHHRPGVD